MIRDESGPFLAIAAAGMDESPLVLQTEAHAFLMGLKLAAELKLKTIEIKTNYRLVINLLSSESKTSFSLSVLEYICFSFHPLNIMLFCFVQDVLMSLLID